MNTESKKLRWLAHRIAGPCAGTPSNPARWIGHSRRTRRHREVLRDRMPGVCAASTLPQCHGAMKRLSPTAGGPVCVTDLRPDSTGHAGIGRVRKVAA